MAASKEFQRSVTVFGVPVDVVFSYSKGYEATEFEPPVDEEIEICAVLVDGLDIYHLCGEKALEEVEKELWKIYNEKGDV